ncbi:MAG: carbohydrate kinase family protein [bacterium]|nr:carbohydrate kinase family protein [bacterium]
MLDVVAIGSATQDVFLKVNFPLVDKSEVPSGKAISLPFGEKLSADDIYFTIGGNAANASITFARQGQKAACISKLGQDDPADVFMKRLNKEGVKTKFIIQTPERPTSFSVLLLQAGERTIINYRGASNTFALEDLNLKKLKANWWYISLSGESSAMLKPLLKFAKENSIRIAFNPTGYHLNHYRQDIVDSLGDIDFLVVNNGEAAELLGMPFDMNKEKEVFQKLDDMVPGIIAVTRGDKGVTVSDGSFAYTAGIFTEQRILDRTGAGDAFGSGFVSTLIRYGQDYKKPEVIKEAIRFASANATSVVENLGASEGILAKDSFNVDSRWEDLKINQEAL